MPARTRRAREARRSATARRTSTSRRGSTPSSPAAPGAAASTSRATRSCSGQPGLDPRAVAGLASTRTYPLRSSLPPVVQHGGQPGRPGRPRAALASCWSRRSRSSRPTGRSSASPARCARARRRSHGYARGDDLPPRRLHRVRRAAPPDHRGREGREARARKAARREAARQSLERLRRGDVIQVPAGSSPASPSSSTPVWSPDGPRPLVRDRRPPGPAAGDARLPDAGRGRRPAPDAEGLQRRSPQTRRDLASTLRSHHPRPDTAARRGPSSGGPVAHLGRPRSPACARLARAHPCHGCPDREDHARWAERYVSSTATRRRCERRVEQRTNTVARTFDRVCEVLIALGYLAGDDVTAQGRPCAGSTPSSTCSSPRPAAPGSGRPRAAGWPRRCPWSTRPAGPRTWCQARVPVGDRARSMVRLCGGAGRGRAARPTGSTSCGARRRPGLGGAPLGPGYDLSEVLDEADLTAGDFVRWCKQLIDLLGQVADAAGDVPYRDTARDSYADPARCRRGPPLED